MTCHGRGKCSETVEGACECFAPWTGPSCLHDACVDIMDCGECVSGADPRTTADRFYWKTDTDTTI